jgi:hypothetical protein
MAKFSKKVMGKEVGQANVYAEPHTMTGKVVKPENVMGTGYPEEAKTTGIKIRGTGCATKGVIARGPMA